jgi:hypothetical protein
MKKLLIINFPILMATILTISCNNITSSINDTLHGRPKVNNKLTGFTAAYHGAAGNFLSDLSALQQAENSFRNIPELKGKRLKVFGDFHLYDDGRIMIAVQDPDSAQNVNSYNYRGQGEWGAKEPVNISSSTAQTLSTLTFPYDSARFTTVARIAAVFAARAQAAGSSSRLTHVYYVPEAHSWYCNEIEGSRASYEIYFNPDGTVKEFKRE